jgi:hypothetical protein
MVSYFEEECLDFKSSTPKTFLVQLLEGGVMKTLCLYIRMSKNYTHTHITGFDGDIEDIENGLKVGLEALVSCGMSTSLEWHISSTELEPLETILPSLESIGLKATGRVIDKIFEGESYFVTILTYNVTYN